MPTVKFNVKGVEVMRGGGEPVPKGVYLCEIDTCAVNKPEGKDQRIEVVYKIKGGDQNGRQLFDYVNLESEHPFAQSRVREFLEAVGVVTDKKEAGTFDPAKLVGKELNVRVIHQADTRDDHKGEMQHRVGGVFAPGEGEAEEEDLDDESGEEEDEVDLDEMDRAELKDLIKENELGIRVTKGMSDDDLRTKIAEALGDGDEEESEDEEPEDEEDEDEVDLDELDRPALKRLIKDNELGITVKKAWSDDDLRKAIADTMGGDNEEEEDEDESPDYESMDMDELKSTLKERGLKTTGSKKILVARLTKDDEARDESEPF